MQPTFPRFLNLPVEIQDLIWEAAFERELEPGRPASVHFLDVSVKTKALLRKAKGIPMPIGPELVATKTNLDFSCYDSQEHLELHPDFTSEVARESDIVCLWWEDDEILDVFDYYHPVVQSLRFMAFEWRAGRPIHKFSCVGCQELEVAHHDYLDRVKQRRKLERPGRLCLGFRKQEHPSWNGKGTDAEEDLLPGCGAESDHDEIVSHCVDGVIGLRHLGIPEPDDGLESNHDSEGNRWHEVPVLDTVEGFRQFSAWVETSTYNPSDFDRKTGKPICKRPTIDPEDLDLWWAEEKLETRLSSGEAWFYQDHKDTIHLLVGNSHIAKAAAKFCPLMTPRLETMYVIDHDLRLRPGKSVPPGTPTFSGYNCLFVEVDIDTEDAMLKDECLWCYDDDDRSHSLEQRTATKL
ncbi:hypothetical protein B0H63DRAFT_510256 [Podospora didyma]|uniref:Uncharacterized protein n=1 Tax=Podospora didyma TaxID=330526 RepID=A0AAE0NPS5_9PEZI|nr:hypothetical protein B0H63DRAFT_510256 [Podospora didyma]